MEETIIKLRENGVTVPVMVGGAVLTVEYAGMIGADYYGKDAKEAVSIANEVVKKN
jgi:5-methyltetrahydrofolate--homocysteine methyltransferase